MDAQDQAEKPASPGRKHVPPASQARLTAVRSPSVVSSRMTDIDSDDEGQSKSANRNKAPDVGSRPVTAQTGTSSKAAWPGAGARKGLATSLQQKRGSTASTTASGRAPSLTTRSHVPSLTSGAFFRPMSSQKLQAQRGAVPRPFTVSQYSKPSSSHRDDDRTDAGGSVRLPPSRGTEMTDQETYDRMTANASPTTGHFPAASLSDSVRPLQGRSVQSRNMNVKVDKSFRDLANLPSPVKSTRSFRSSFLLPGKVEQSQADRKKSTDGAEKLSSVASSPGLPRAPSNAGSRAAAPQPTESKLGRVHQYFDGNTVFCLGGRWQNTKQLPINVATGLFVVVPCALFFGFEAPWLWENVSPAIPLTFAYVTYICVSSFIHASVSDPGILPRHLHQFPPVAEQDDPLRLGPPTNDWTLVKSAEATAAAMEVPVKHCRTCNIWRPPRAHHCRLCDNCVEGHDHHCVWLNNCVGKRNYRYFFTFVSSATLLAIYLIGTSLTQILLFMDRETLSFGESIDHFRVPFALVILGILCLIYPGGLTGYHLFLMSRGETTREYINSHKFVKKDRYRAYSQGNWLKNLCVVLCRPRLPSYYQFKGKYKAGDQRLGIHHHLRGRSGSQGLELGSVPPTASTGFQGPVALRGQTN